LKTIPCKWPHPGSYKEDQEQRREIWEERENGADTPLAKRPVSGKRQAHEKCDIVRATWIQATQGEIDDNTGDPNSAETSYEG
jgi:hypothetical protein